MQQVNTSVSLGLRTELCLDQPKNLIVNQVNFFDTINTNLITNYNP